MELLDAFVAAWARGETPDPRETLGEAPAEDRAALAEALDRALAATPAREPSPLNRSYVAALRARLEHEEPPLLAARVAQGTKRADVVQALVRALGLTGAEEKVALRYHELETGQLDGRRVLPDVWSAIASVLGDAAVAVAKTWRPPEQPRGVVFHRRADAAAAPAAWSDQLLESGAASDVDEVDRLFGVPPS